MTQSTLSQRNQVLLRGEILLKALLILLYCYTAYNSFGYDDEYFNIRMVRENSLGNMIHGIQTSDLHPPLSYILNYLLYHLTDNWALVRLCSALLFLSALLYTSGKIHQPQQRIVLLLLLGLNPTTLLWVTGLRWYAYMVPLLLLWLHRTNDQRWYYWPRFFLLALLVCYTGYAGLFLAIPYFIYYWIADHRPIRRKIQSALIYGAVFMAAYAYQLYILLTVHSKINLGDASNKQVFDIKASASALIASLASNQGLFPLSWPGLCAIAGTAILYLLTLVQYKKTIAHQQWMVFLFGGLIFILTGIAGKVRNLVLLEPARAGVMSHAVAGAKKWWWIGLVLLLLGNTVGIYHVVTHRQTTKNAWNIPLRETLDILDQMETPGRKEIYFTHHPSFTFYLVNQQKNLISFYNTLYFGEASLPPSFTSLLSDTGSKRNFTFLRTFDGQTIPAAVQQRMQEAMETVQADSVKRWSGGYDPEYHLKQKFFPGYPPYAVELVKYYGVKRADTASLRVWDRGQ